MNENYKLTNEERDLLEKLIDKYILEEIIYTMKCDKITIDEVDLEQIMEEYTNEIFFSRREEKEFYEEEIKKLGILDKDRKIKKEV